jgi:hypothetical protein
MVLFPSSLTTPSSFNTIEMKRRKAASQYGEIPPRCLHAEGPASYPGLPVLFQWITTAAFTYLEDMKLGAISISPVNIV